jgi:hypothetical protein
MTRIPVAVATTVAALAALAACAQEVRFVPGQGSFEELTDTERGAARLAIETLASDLGIAPESIEVDTVKAIEWRNSSLGCPKPGVAYLDVVTPGHKVILRVGKEIHVVHEAGNRAFRCEQTKNLGGMTAGGDLTFGPQLVAARRDLAARLGVTERDIQFVAAESKTFSDASLGCAEPGMQYAQAQVAGWVLTFRRGERLFTYHADDQHAIPCPPVAAD